ncbi:MAG: metal-binding protein, partial [Pseudomonadales bacterium]|nr:metal-binding protein [Pseudomonadales bacterium]
PDRYDPILVESSGLMPLRSLVEDDLILALPIVAYHDSSCGYANDEKQTEEPGVEASVENPFSVLEILKH